MIAAGWISEGYGPRGSRDVRGAAADASRSAGGGRDHRRRLDLDARAILDQRLHLDGGHRREMAADDLAVDGAERAIARDVLALVDDVPRHAHDVLGPRARLREHATTLASAWRACATKSSDSNRCCPFQPIWPPTYTCVPRAATPFA